MPRKIFLSGTDDYFYKSNPIEIRIHEQTIKHQINYNNIVAAGGLITWLFLVDWTLQVATILIAKAPKILKLATWFVKKSP